MRTAKKSRAGGAYKILCFTKEVLVNLKKFPGQTKAVWIMWWPV
ncbi:hypothetical protein CE91St46_03800 [Eubacteriales bacterium]|nr:hypothetical protein CE91St46_03800 [Eubacteriales bacterium]GKH61910.1 hypothetical protein CE91St47_03790 [Eubacteriales bacterium]SFJ45944.1 hypothetical protein SAMN02910435_02101 [Ruminococcaceae bacterium D5]